VQGQYDSRVTDDGEFTIRLSKDQALVLSEWLYHVMGVPAFDNLVNDQPAVWSSLHRIAGTLDKSLVEVFMPDNSGRLHGARVRLLDGLGDVGRPHAGQ
jgi:hypothetical protein